MPVTAEATERTAAGTTAGTAAITSAPDAARTAAIGASLKAPTNTARPPKPPRPASLIAGTWPTASLIAGAGFLTATARGFPAALTSAAAAGLACFTKSATAPGCFGSLCSLAKATTAGLTALGTNAATGLKTTTAGPTGFTDLASTSLATFTALAAFAAAELRPQRRQQPFVLVRWLPGAANVCYHRMPQ